MTLLQHCTFQEYVFNGQSLATMLASSWWSSGQNMGFCGIGMANSESGYHNLLSSGQVPKSLGWSKCWFQEIQISTMYRYIPLNLDLLLNVRVYQWLQICKVDSRQWVYVMIEGLLCKLVHYLIPLCATMAWHPAEVDTSSLVAQCPEEIQDLANKRVVVVVSSPSIACKQDIESE